MIRSTQRRSSSSMSADRSMSASCGAMTPSVEMRSAATSRSTSSARQREMRWSVQPVWRYQASFVIIPTWASWVDATSGPPIGGLDSQPSPRSMSQIARNWRLRKTAPFGVPVVPDVYTIATARSGTSSSSRGGVLWSSRRARFSGVVRPHPAASIGWSATRSVGVRWATRRSCSGTARLGLMPAVVAPRRAAARYVTT